MSRVVVNDPAGNDVSVATETTMGSLLAKFGALVNGAAPVSVISRSNNAYMVAAHVIPGTLTTGTVYFSLHNDSSSTEAKLTRLRITVNFTGTAAATRSLFDVLHITGATPSGGTDLTVLKMDKDNAAAAMDGKLSTAGITVSGATETLIRTISQMSQLTAQQVFDLDLRDTPLVLANGEGIIIKANGAIVSGCAFSVDAKWEEAAV